MKFKEILDKALNLMKNDSSYNLFDAITDITEQYKDLDYEEFAKWLKLNKPLVDCLQNDIMKKRLYKDGKIQNTSIDVGEFF